MVTPRVAGRGPLDRRIVAGLKGIAVVAVGLLASGTVAGCAIDDSTAVPAPAATERADTVAVLAKATQTQGVCYGWRLADGVGNLISEGSNLGDKVPVQLDPVRCPRWVEVGAQVTYTAESSESEDSATFWVTTSTHLSERSLTEGLTRLGLDEAAFIDDPGWAICRAAVFLPLLASEAGAAAPVPAVTDTSATAPKPLPDPGSDFWRDRWLYLLGAGALVLVTTLLVTIGWHDRRHQHRADSAVRARSAAPAPRTERRGAEQRR